MSRLRHLLPNLVTSANLAVGLVAILISFRGEPVDAAWLVMLCVLLDKADGSLARLLEAQTPLGVQLDSFSDFLSFCTAPAVMWTAALTAPGLPTAAWPLSLTVYASTILFTLAGAVRLARFNWLEQEGAGLKGFFQGIPTTLAGAFLATLLAVLHTHDLLRPAATWIPPVMVLAALLMVSPWYLPKLVKRKSRLVNWFTLTNLFLVPLLILLRELPEYLLFLVFLYIGVGMTWANRRNREIA